MKIEGYKALFDDCSTRDGTILKAKNIYICNSVIKFRHSGYHFCKRLEDTLRYYDGFKEIQFARVIGSGIITTYDDEYYGYYDMYACSELYVDHFLSKQEINTYIEKLIKLAPYNPERILRFIRGYKLTNKQKEQIVTSINDKYTKERCHKAIEYYQENKKYVYEINSRWKNERRISNNRASKK